MHLQGHLNGGCYGCPIHQVPPLHYVADDFAALSTKCPHSHLQKVRGSMPNELLQGGPLLISADIGLEIVHHSLKQAG